MHVDVTRSADVKRQQRPQSADIKSQQFYSSQRQQSTDVKSQQIYSSQRQQSADVKSQQCYSSQHQQSADVKGQQCYKNNLNKVNEVEFYDYLKLLVDGDIESNPGPNGKDLIEPKKGRPKKRGFAGTPKKVTKLETMKSASESLVDKNMQQTNSKHMTRNNNEIRNISRGLQNQGENVCFFNSIIQMLNSLGGFQNEILSLESSDDAVNAVKNLIREIASSENDIKTSQFLQQIRLRGCVFGMQYDAHECLSQILEKIYGNFDDCIFTVSCLESVQCVGSHDGTINGCGMNQVE